MADTIERTIYKLEIDDSSYTKGVESVTASTNKLSQAQDAANKRLQTNEAALKAQAQVIEQARKALESYTGTNAKYQQQLDRDVKKAESEQVRLIKIVDESRAAYDRATRAAAEFATTTARANNLQSQPGQRIAPQPVLPQTNPLAQFNTGELADIVQNTTSDFTALAAAIELAEQAMAGLDEESEEFKTLAPIVEQGKVVLAEYAQAAEQAAGGQTSLRTQIRLGREELVRLEEQGKGNTKEYFELEKRVAKLTDAFGDQQQRIKILASDTKLLDFGKGAITAATSAFSAFTSVQILAGDQSEELQKKTMQLFAAMQLLQSLEQLSNLTRREGVLATLAQSGAQAAYTAVVGASTGALRVFKLALAATGIGLAIAAIALLVQRYNELQEATREAEEQQKALLDINKQAVDSYAKEVTSLKLLSAEYSNSATSLSRKKEIQDELQASYPAYFKSLDTQADKEAFIAQQVEKVTQALIIQAKVQAAQTLLTEKFAKLLKEQFDPTEAVGFFDALGSSLRNFGDIAGSATDLSETAKNNIAKAQKEYTSFEKFITDFVTKSNAELEKLGGDPKADGDKGTKGVRAIENVFIQERDRLLAALAKLRADEGESIQKINDEFAAKLIVEQNRIAGLLKDKKLTPGQADTLVKLAVEINITELNKALADFNKKVTDARKKLNDELLDLQNKNTEDQLSLIQDEFTRRAALIDFNEKQAVADAEQNQIDRLAALEFDRLLLGEQAYQDAKAIIVTQGEQEVVNITGRFAAQRQDLAADTFKRSLDLISQVFDESLLQLDEENAGQIQQQKGLLDRGLINYDQFQKNITQILKVEKENRDKIRLDELNSELESINKRLEATTDAAEREELQKRQRSVRGAIADINSQTGDIVDPNAKRVETLTDYVQQVGALADSVIQFWAKANEAEAAALDRSIALQERRVEAAQRIAERGNASYLKAEEDRLQQLQVARENAARRDLAINAALQASQLLVGITGAIAKIATPGIGIAETIGAIAVIFSTLASGYALAKSLQGNQPTFFTGTKDTGHGGKDDHRGGFTATLHPHEAVIPADRNKEYKPVIDAVYDRKIPAKDLNHFVNYYHKVKPVPQPNYTRIKEAAELKTSSDGRLAVELSEQNRLIQENNDLQRTTIRTLRAMKMDVNLDKNGFAASWMEVVEQTNRDKKL